MIFVVYLNCYGYLNSWLVSLCAAQSRLQSSVMEILVVLGLSCILILPLTGFVMC
jgi:hypothetical protein